MRHTPIDTLRAFVRERGTQQVAAEALGIRQGYLSEMLSGRRRINPRVLHAIGLEEKTIYRKISLDKDTARP